MYQNCCAYALNAREMPEIIANTFKLLRNARKRKAPRYLEIIEKVENNWELQENY